MRLPTDFDIDAEASAAKEGILDGAVIEMPDGESHSVFFIGIQRLENELNVASESGLVYFARPAMIVMSTINTWTCTMAIYWAGRQGYFSSLYPPPYPHYENKDLSVRYSTEELLDGSERGEFNVSDIQVEGSRRYSLTFAELTSLRRDLELGMPNGRPFIVEPGLIAVAEINRSVIDSTIEKVAADGFFSHLRPLST